jgi:AcrR family transcriptional regulator
VQARRAAARDQILDAAWRLARRDGLGALSLRELGAEVGMRAQSLYSYFDGKHAIYDAMFRQGYEQLIDQVAADPGAPVDELSRAEVREFVRGRAEAYFEFCVADPVRHQLLFQRVIPGFEPSAESYAVAVDAYERTVGQLRVLVGADDADLDLWTAVMSGLVSQQIANDPGGTRWQVLLPRAVELLVPDPIGSD